MTAPTRLALELEPTDAIWQRVHEALKAFDPVRYDECETDELLQCLFEIISEEIQRGYRAGKRSRKRKSR